MSTKVWVISQLYYPEQTSTGYFLTKIAEGLAAENSVCVLCGQPSYSARGVKAPWRETRNGVDIKRCLGTTLNKNVLVYKLINFITISLSIFFQALWQVRRGDVVLVVTNPPTLPFLIALVCRLKRARLILLIHDVYPEVLIAVGKAKPTSMLVRLLARLSKWLYSGAERIIVLGRDMAKLALAKLPPGQATTVVIPNWSDIDELMPELSAENKLLSELGLQGKFVLQYAGNMGYPNDLETIVEAAVRLADREDIHFMFIGSGTKRPWLEREVANRALKNITLLDSRPRSEQQLFLNACDVAIVSLVNGMAGVGVPSRTYNILATGRPMIAIAESESEVALVAVEENVGWVVAPGDVEALVRMILAASSDRNSLAEMGTRARAVAEQKYSFATIIEAYRQVIRDVATGAQAR